MRKPFLVALTGLTLAACGPGEEPQTPDLPAECDLDQDQEKQPGYPYDLAKFRSDIWPDLQATCTNGACHAAPNGIGGFSVFPQSEDTCPDIQSFKSFIGKVDYRNVAGSVLIRNLNGQDPHTPAFGAENALTIEITAFVQAAADLDNPPTDQTNLFDKDVFAAKVQPALDDAGCSGGNCHGAPAGIAGLIIKPNPANPSADLDANFEALTSTKYINQAETDAADVRLYLKSTDGHGGANAVLAGGDLTELDNWIQAALDIANETPGQIELCEDKASFNVGVFRDEIRPMLEGNIDYNDINGGGSIRTGCTRGPCHGENRGPGTFYLKEGGTDEELLNSFRCFVDLSNPTASEVLLCPLNLSGSRSGQRHPGEDVFDDVLDLNYQKLLSFLYATGFEEDGIVSSPLDFAFFAREINPIFSNPADCAETNTACADGGCHERQSDGSADNGSNFPLIRDATDEVGIKANFFAAANFVLFTDPTQSSLFLYPTDEISDVDNNVLATGDNHPGGECFPAGSPQADAIVKFAGGIRPNGEGFLQDFLVAGVFPAANVTDNVAPFDEATISPKIFQESGQSIEFNAGEWDGLFSDVEVVDLFEAFPGAQGNVNQIAYALAFVINSSSVDEEVVVTVESENDIELFVGNSSTIGRDGDGASLTATLPAYQDSQELTRIMIKVFQKAGNETFAFTMNFTDENGVPLTDLTKELVFVLAEQNGGI